MKRLFALITIGEEHAHDSMTRVLRGKCHPAHHYLVDVSIERLTSPLLHDAG